MRKLDAEADELKLPDEEVLHGTLIDLGNIFIGLLFVTQPETLRRLAFLTVFYASPLRVRGYALARLVATNLPGEWWERLAKIHQTLEPYFEVGITFPRTIDEPYGRVTTQPGAPLSARAQKAAHALPWATGLRYAVDRAQWLRREGARLGDLPSQLSEAHNPPTDEFVIEFASRVTQLQVEIPVLELWAAVILLKQFFEVEHFDYSEFTPRFAELEKALITELAKVDHEGVGDRFKGWIKDQKDLQDDMVSSARKQAIKREVIGAIPALMLAPFAAEAAGAWIAEAVSTARWVIILGRAAAVTAVMQLVGPSGGVGGRPTVTGVLEQFGINLLSEGLGSLLRKFADIAETSNGIRRVMFKVLSARPTAFVVSTATVTAAQVAVAKLEAKVRGQGGETDITALLTLNAILNGLGFILGAAVRWPRKAARGETVTVAELVEFNRSEGIVLDETIAEKLIKLRIISLRAVWRQLGAEAEAGTLTPEQVAANKAEMLRLLGEVKGLVPGIAEARGMKFTTADVLAWLDEMGRAIGSLTHPGPQARVLALPETTPKLFQLESRDIWGFDPKDPPEPKATEALKATYLARRNDVVDLVPGEPNRGWEARDPQGRAVIQVLPVQPQVRGLLPPAVKDVGHGEQFDLGVARLQAQVDAPLLEAQLGDFLSRGGDTLEARMRLVERVLQVLGRPGFSPTPRVWQGLSRFLQLEGDVAVLARVMRYIGDSKGDLAAVVLTEFSNWDADAVHGLEALYRIRPNTTGEQLFALFGDFPEQLTLDLFRAINDLAPPRSIGLAQVIGRLTSGDLSERATSVVSPQQRGALGELFRGITLQQANPGKTIGFGVRQRVTDPVTQKEVLRVIDVAVLDVAPGEPSKVPAAQAPILFREEVKEDLERPFGRQSPLRTGEGHHQ